MIILVKQGSADGYLFHRMKALNSDAKTLGEDSQALLLLCELNGDAFFSEMVVGFPFFLGAIMEDDEVEMVGMLQRQLLPIQIIFFPKAELKQAAIHQIHTTEDSDEGDDELIVHR